MEDRFCLLAPRRRRRRRRPPAPRMLLAVRRSVVLPALAERTKERTEKQFRHLMSRPQYAIKTPQPPPDGRKDGRGRTGGPPCLPTGPCQDDLCLNGLLR